MTLEHPTLVIALHTVDVGWYMKQRDKQVSELVTQSKGETLGEPQGVRILVGIQERGNGHGVLV